MYTGVMDTNQSKVRKARLLYSPDASGLLEGASVRVVSARVPFPFYRVGESPSNEYYLVSVDEEQEFVDLESTEDPVAGFYWEYGTTVWAEPEALQFEDERHDIIDVLLDEED